MTKLTLRRAKDSGALLRRIKIEVDGDVAARLRPGNSRTVELSNGQHIVTARIDWISSKPLNVDLGDGEEMTIETSCNARAYIDMVRRPRDALDIQVI